MLRQQPRHDALERIAFARPLGLGSPLILEPGQPFGDGLRMEVQLPGKLGRCQTLLRVQVMDLMEGLVVNHAAPPASARRRMSPTLKRWSNRVSLGADATAVSGKAST